jgi:hypothetical protein
MVSGFIAASLMVLETALEPIVDIFEGTCSQITRFLKQIVPMNHRVKPERTVVADGSDCE